MNRYPLELIELKDRNLIKYRGVPPSFELIRDVIKKSKLKRVVRFEKVWGLPKDTVRLYINGYRPLPSTYWHIFYDFDNVQKPYKKRTFKKRAEARTVPTKLIPNKHFIDDFKLRQSTG